MSFVPLQKPFRKARQRRKYEALWNESPKADEAQLGFAERSHRFSERRKRQVPVNLHRETALLKTTPEQKKNSFCRPSTRCSMNVTAKRQSVIGLRTTSSTARISNRVVTACSILYR